MAIIADVRERWGRKKRHKQITRAIEYPAYLFRDVHVDLSGMRVTAKDLEHFIPMIKQKHPELVHLSLDRNGLTELPAAIGQLNMLQTLSLKENKLTALPPTIAELNQLVTLKGSYNKLLSLPPEITRLDALEILDLHKNQISALPDDLGSMNKLYRLNLAHNALREVPESLTRLGANTPAGVGQAELEIQNNPLTAQTRSFLDSFGLNYRIQVSYNMAAYHSIFDPNAVLKELYGEGTYREKAKKLKMLKVGGTFQNGRGETIPAQTVIREFLVRVPAKDGSINEEHKKMTVRILDRLLGTSSNEEKCGDLQTMATALGDCETNVKSLLDQLYIGSMGREALEQLEFGSRDYSILAREALERSITRRAKELRATGQVVFRDNELVEQMQGLTNALFLDLGEGHPDNKLRIHFGEGERPAPLPSKTNYITFAFQRVGPELADAFAKMCCMTGESGLPMRTENDAFIFHGGKLDSMVRSLVQSITGEESPHQAKLESYRKAVQETLGDTELSSAYDNEAVMASGLVDVDGQVEELSRVLDTTADPDSAYEQYLQEKKEQIEKLAQTIGESKTSEFQGLGAPAAAPMGHSGSEVPSPPSPSHRTGQGTSRRTPGF